MTKRYQVILDGEPGVPLPLARANTLAETYRRLYPRAVVKVQVDVHIWHADGITTTLTAR